MHREDFNAVWVTSEFGRHSIEKRAFGGGFLIVFFEQFNGYAATRYTWAWVNGLADTGLIEFTDLSGPGLNTVNGKHIIAVGGMLPARTWRGNNATQIQNYLHVTPTSGYPAICASHNQNGLNNTLGTILNIGPYRLEDAAGGFNIQGNSSFNSSEGGWGGVNPFWMGPQGWQRASRSGYKWAEQRMLGQASRYPTAYFDSDLEPTNPHEPYWCGRTDAHRLSGWPTEFGDGWCPYADLLTDHRAHNLTHGSRGFNPPAMLQPVGDQFAKWWLKEVAWNDVTCWLDGASGTGDAHFETLAEVLANYTHGQGWSDGGRQFAHAVRLFNYVNGEHGLGAGNRDTDDEPWEDVIPEFITEMTFATGVMHRAGTEGCVLSPSARSREVDLLGLEFETLGLTDLRDAWRIYMAPTPTGDPDVWTSVGTTVEADQPVSWDTGETTTEISHEVTICDLANYYPYYDAFRRDYRHALDQGGYLAILQNPQLGGFQNHFYLETYADMVYPDAYGIVEVPPSGGESMATIDGLDLMETIAGEDMETIS